MKKQLAVFSIAVLAAYACSQKTATTVSTSEPTIKTESATVNHERYLAGKTIYDAKCGRCHKLYKPQEGNMTQWNKWIDRMAPKAKLTEEETALVRDYVSVNAKPM
ncbi:MAG TPA: hypothetical protein PLA16_06760 [Chitinophagales bacterium]|jgi:cytochrome c5|nr:hypothetical protein [Chitinophagales bacterium]